MNIQRDKSVSNHLKAVLSHLFGTNYRLFTVEIFALCWQKIPVLHQAHCSHERFRPLRVTPRSKSEFLFILSKRDLVFHTIFKWQDGIQSALLKVGFWGGPECIGTKLEPGAMCKNWKRFLNLTPLVSWIRDQQANLSCAQETHQPRSHTLK